MRTDLVTGASGFIGSHLVDDLVSNGRIVRALLRPTSSTKWLPAEHVEIVQCTAWQPRAISAVLDGVDTVYHVAGTTHAHHRRDFFTFHVDGTRTLLEACLLARNAPRRIVVFSSLAAAGPSFSGSLITEDDEPRPISWYGESKLAQERVTRDFAHELSVVIVRPPAVYGPRDRDLLHVFRMIRRGFAVAPFHGRGMQSFTHVLDVVQGARKAASADVTSGATYFIASHEVATWYALAVLAGTYWSITPRIIHVPRHLLPVAGLLSELTASITGRSFPLDRNKAQEGMYRHWICSCRKAQRELGFQGAVSLGRGVADTLDWYIEAGWLRKS